MDQRVAKLRTPEDCLRFEKNALTLDRPDLATEARNRALALQASRYGAKTQAEQECLQAVYAYERILTEKNGRTTRASRTWPLIERKGVIAAVESIVTRERSTMGFDALAANGLDEHAFEAVVLRHPQHFSEAAVSTSKRRLEAWRAGSGCGGS